MSKIHKISEEIIDSASKSIMASFALDESNKDHKNVFQNIFSGVIAESFAAQIASVIKESKEKDQKKVIRRFVSWLLVDIEKRIKFHLDVESNPDEHPDTL